jgi:TDG/mug DNA glycosylase family protein
VRHVAFAPVARADAVVLILGSLPGRESLEKREYYARRANQFWPIMGALVGASPDLAYAARLEVLRAHRIALWDVCASAMRVGSLDTAIVAPVVNDFAAFLDEHPAIRLICFNGGKAEALFRAHVPPALVPGELGRDIRYHRLPSTSPAYAAMRPAGKAAAWRATLEAAVVV